MFYSPLRYPGGKSKLAPLMQELIIRTGHEKGTWIEPFAGGAGIALYLLEQGVVNQIVLNDADKGIYSFWWAVLNQTDRLIRAIAQAPLTVDEWNRQKRIATDPQCECGFELGFATFYLNRTCRSGIVTGGLMGGVKQNERWKMDVRFNKKSLTERIEKIANKKEFIRIANADASDFIQKQLVQEKNEFLYFDPPYFEKGQQLYSTYLRRSEHEKLANAIDRFVTCDWVMTYDEAPEIRKLYANYPIRNFDLKYSVATKRTASELIIFKDERMVSHVKGLDPKKIHINIY